MSVDYFWIFLRETFEQHKSKFMRTNSWCVKKYTLFVSSSRCQKKTEQKIYAMKKRIENEISKKTHT